jgi:hypothetical protein
MPRFSKIALFPYTFNEQDDMMILFMLDTKKEILVDFGGEPNEYEPTVYYPAVRNLSPDISFEPEDLYK